jgi:hypothetical protein
VLFANKNDALRAIREYNDRTFDGRPMKLELIISPMAIAGTSSVGSRLGAPIGGYACLLAC